MAVTVIEVNKQTYPVHTGIHSREPNLALDGRGPDLDQAQFKDMNIRCAKHLFVTAILTGPRARRTGSRIELSLKGRPHIWVTTSWLAPDNLLPILYACLVNPCGTLHFPMLRGFERVKNVYV